MHLQHALAIVQRCTRRSLVFCGAVMLLVAMASLPPALGDESRRQQITGEEAILAALEQKVSFSHVDEPLDTVVVDYLRKNLQIETRVDYAAIEKPGMGFDPPITVSVTDLKLCSALDLILRNLDLAWTIRDGVLLVTTPEEAEQHLITRVYDLGDLMAVSDSEGRRWQDFDTLLAVIESSIEPNSWALLGGPGEVAPLAYRGANVLVVRQTLRVQEQVARLLKRLTAIADKYGDDAYPTYDPVTSACEMVRRRMWLGAPRVGSKRSALAESTPDEVAQSAARNDPIRTALEQRVSVDFIDEPLCAVATFVREHYHIEVQLDIRALDDVNMGADTPISIRVANVTLRSALNLMRRDLDLAWVIVDDVLLITTPEEAAQHLTTRVHDLGNLIKVYDTQGKPEQNFHSLMNVIESTIRPESWDVFGGPCSICPMQNRGSKVLVVWQTREGHEEVAWLLKELKSIADRYGDDVFPVIEPAHTDAEPEDRQGGERLGAGEDGT